MKIYILRHEKRPEDCSFFVPLSEEGLNDSIKLISHLKKCNIDLIFSSPFIRTLQTIYPYAKSENKKINLEYGLCELHHEDIIPKKGANMLLPNYLAKSFLVNDKYETLIKNTDITYPEKVKDCENRMLRVLRYVIEKYNKTNHNIVLVTHQNLCSAALKVVSKYVKIDEDEIENYEKGKLTLVFDNNVWQYKKIN